MECCKRYEQKQVFAMSAAATINRRIQTVEAKLTCKSQKSQARLDTYRIRHCGCQRESSNGEKTRSRKSIFTIPQLDLCPTDQHEILCTFHGKVSKVIERIMTAVSTLQEARGYCREIPSHAVGVLASFHLAYTPQCCIV